MSHIHNRIRQLRRDKNLSQEGLAKQLGISRQALIAIEQGSSLPSLRVIMALIDALEVTFGELCGPAWSPFRTEAPDTEETTQLSVHRINEHSPTMAVTMHEDAYSFHIYAELAGVKEEDLTVDLSTQHALIVAVKRPHASSPIQSVHLHEINFGPMLRVITLPAPINTDQARADLSNGMLHLILTKARPEISRRITFKSKQS